MLRILALTLISFVFSFFVATTVVNAQTATSSPTTTPTPTTSSSTPNAPNTGFGG